MINLTSAPQGPGDRLVANGLRTPGPPRTAQRDRQHTPRPRRGPGHFIPHEQG